MTSATDPIEEVFTPEQIRALGLEYRDGTVRTLNRSGYMRNFLCPASQAFCRQPFTAEDAVLEVGCGIGAVLETLVQKGARRITAVDMEPQHLDLARQLLAPSLAVNPAAQIDFVADTLPRLASLGTRSYRSILCAQVLQYLRPEQFTEGALRLRELLLPGGSLYVTLGTPYLKVYQGFAEEYERRRVAGDRFPGFMDDPRKYHPSGANHNPGFFLFFDPEVLSSRLTDCGFIVTDAFFMQGAGQDRGQATAIAQRPA